MTQCSYANKRAKYYPPAYLKALSAPQIENMLRQKYFQGRGRANTRFGGGNILNKINNRFRKVQGGEIAAREGFASWPSFSCGPGCVRILCLHLILEVFLNSLCQNKMKSSDLLLHLDHLKQVRTQERVGWKKPQFLFCPAFPQKIIICPNIILK